jgi:hypothetical protein
VVVPELIIRCSLKVTRAIEHLKAFDEAAKRFGDEHGDPGFQCVVEPNSQRTKILVKIDQNVEFPDVEWGIIIGDAVHCLRSALDQLVAGLCTEPPTRRTRFPICLTEKAWIIDSPGQIWSVPEEYVAVINGAQPYHAGDTADAHPLALLNALWNLDKHETIPAVALTASGMRLDVVGAEGVTDWETLKFRTRLGRPLERGTVLGEATFRDIDTEDNAKVDVDAHLSINVAFGQIGKAAVISGKPVSDTFKNLICPAVHDVLRGVLDVHSASP